VQAGFGVHAVRQGECASVSVRGEVIRAWIARLQQAGVQCLVRNAFFQGARLKVFQVAAGNADVQALVFFEGGSGHRPVCLGALRGIGDGLQSARFQGLQYP
jgi:hypothetical protein